MHTNIKRALWGVAIAGGLTLLGSSAAGAAETDGEEGILSGTQIQLPISIPVNIIDNAVSLLGSSTVEAPAAAAPAPADAPAAAPASAATDGSDGVGSGTQAIIEVAIPITVSGNSIAVLGDAESTAVDQPAQPAPAPAPAPAASGASTSGEDGLLSGTQGLISVAVPVTISDNAIALLGESTVNQAAPAAPGATDGVAPDQASGGQAVTDGSDSLLGGTQILAPISAPVNVIGNAISILGESTVTGNGTGAGAAPAAPATDLLAPVTSGLGSLLGGTQIALPISIPITIGGNAIAVLGESTVTGPTPAVDPGPNPGTDTGPVPGVDPGPNPGADPGPGPDPGAAPTPAATGTGTLATTGAAHAGMLPLALSALVLLLAGGLLLRRRAA